MPWTMWGVLRRFIQSRRNFQFVCQNIWSLILPQRFFNIVSVDLKQQNQPKKTNWTRTKPQETYKIKDILENGRNCIRTPNFRESRILSSSLRLIRSLNSSKTWERITLQPGGPDHIHLVCRVSFRTFTCSSVQVNGAAGDTWWLTADINVVISLWIQHRLHSRTLDRKLLADWWCRINVQSYLEIFTIIRNRSTEFW